MRHYRRTIATVIGATLSLYATGVSASGFAIIEQNVSGLGNAFASGSAGAEDASTVYFNPAGMSRLEGAQFKAAAHLIVPSSKFKEKGSNLSSTLVGLSLLGGGTPGTTISGGNGGDGGEPGVVPNLYYTRAFTDKLHFGLGVNAPFGLATDYNDGWIGRYHTLKTELATININPSLSYQLTDRLSLGVGVSAMYADLRELSFALDSYAVCSGAVSSQLPAGTPTAVIAGAVAGNCGPAGLTAPGVEAQDSRVKLEGDDWGYGFNVGLLFQADENTRIGIAYRSKVELTIEGDATFRVNPGLQAFLTGAGTTLLSDTGFKADLDLPETVSISSYQRISDRWTMMGDITWTRWSRFSELAAEFDNPQQPGLTEEQNWRDTYRFSLGMTYDYDSRWKIRSGIAFDEGAIKHRRNRNPRIPDNDRFWLALGLSYAYSDSLQFDLGYAHLFIKDSGTSQVNPSSGHQLVGDFETHVDIVSGELRWTF